MVGLNSKALVYLAFFCAAVFTDLGWARQKRDVPSFVFMIDSPTPNLQNIARDKVSIQVKNLVGASIVVECKSEKDSVVKQKLKAREGLAFSFQTNMSVTTRYWCDVKWGSWTQRFPAYGDGAPLTSNVVEINKNGIFINNVKYTKW